MDVFRSKPATTGGRLWFLTSWIRRRHSDAVPLPPPVELAQAPSAPTSPSDVRVLVVDDNPSNLGAASGLLEQCGISALLAADGAEAVALVLELAFDLVLMDLQMPVLDGLEATLAIRRDEALHARPPTAILAFSAHGPAKELLLAKGFSGVLYKPCDLDEMEACLVRWCPRYRPFSAGRVETKASVDGLDCDRTAGGVSPAL